MICARTFEVALKAPAWSVVLTISERIAKEAINWQQK
jgi:hypothetical protein